MDHTHWSPQPRPQHSEGPGSTGGTRGSRGGACWVLLAALQLLLVMVVVVLVPVLLLITVVVVVLLLLMVVVVLLLLPLMLVLLQMGRHAARCTIAGVRGWQVNVASSACGAAAATVLPPRRASWGSGSRCQQAAGRAASARSSAPNMVLAGCLLLLHRGESEVQ